MNKIWVNQLIAGTKTWNEMPASRRSAVKEMLLEKLEKNEISKEQYESITGETTTEKEEPVNE